jgi:hypothetical protein
MRGWIGSSALLEQDNDTANPATRLGRRTKARSPQLLILRARL